MEKILVIDDEMGICTSIEFALEDEYKVFIANNLEDAYEILESEQILVVLLDLRLGESSGMDGLDIIKQKYKNIQVIMMTAYSSIEDSVKAIKKGAFYYLKKPINIEELKILILKALEYEKLNYKISHLSDEVYKKYNMGNIIGKSKGIKRLFETIEDIKDINVNVLITGESGTGKEMVAKAVHYQGNRSEYNFEAINCASIPSDLLESELFGYVKGAFTGAVSNKTGKLEVANKGTFFLDEICDMDLHLQSKLLRVIQEKEFTRLGSNEKIKIDVRFIAATNKNIELEIENKKFREDLYYRLNVINIRIPALRERKEDIPLLIEEFIQKYSTQFGKKITGINSEAFETLMMYDYKGNVRELENIIARLVALSKTLEISIDDFQYDSKIEKSPINNKNIIMIKVGENFKEIEKKVIIKTLATFDGNKRKTADALGISERSLYNKINIFKV